MEPLLPEAGSGELAELTVEIFKKSGELKASLPSPLVREEIAQLVCGMSSYYSNLIEGHKALPKDIAKAMNESFSEDDENRRNQQLGVAHIQVERAMRERLSREPGLDVFSPEFLRWLHHSFYSHLPGSEWFNTSLDGKKHPVVPGAFRDHNVGVNRHLPPIHGSLPVFMNRFHRFYSSGGILATNRLVALAAAHHRLVWIHPFGDGNGRVARLQSQAAMIRAGIDGDGLWTLSRGLARARSEYYRQLQIADRERRNDFDGRGNLSDRGLADFCQFFLGQVLDQIEFMIHLISPSKLRERIRNYLRYERLDFESKAREHASRLLDALCIQGEMPRGQVPAVLGLKGTMTREVLKRLFDAGLIRSRSEKGPVRLAFPDDVVEFYFPRLFTDLPVEGE